MELFEHQKIGIEFLKKTKKAILADEMGLGKTKQAVMAAGEESEDGVIIICPASLKINWAREILSVYPDANIKIINSDDTFQGLIPKWFIINYDILEKKTELIKRIIESGARTLILDEVHYIKGNSVRAMCVVGGRKKKEDGTILKTEGIASKMERVYCLTGTPLLNRPIEMFNLLKAIGHRLGEVRGYYSKRYCGAFTRSMYIRKFKRMIYFTDESGATNLDELREQLKGVMIRRKKKDVLDLPEKIISIMECDLNAEWKKTYDNAWDYYMEFLKMNPMPERNIDNILMARQLVEIQKLKQVCSKSKVERMVTDIESAIEQGEKVIVFTQYTETLKMIAQKTAELKFEVGTDAFGKPKKEKIGVVTLSGEDDMDERQKAVDQFQKDPTTKVFVANIKAGGVGLTLTAGSIVMFADMEWSPEIHKQAEDRAHRIGQGGTVNVYYYIAAGTIEEDIVEILNSKKNIMDQVLEGGKKRLRKSSVQEEFLKLMAKKADVHK